MAKSLVIVESPAKAKTIEKFLGKSHYTVKASVGHIRDLPKSKLGVDIENNFEPQYINIRGKGDVIKELKKEAKKAKQVFLATDPDREGEAISWHLAHILSLDETENCRIEFNEITKDAIKKAIKSPRNIKLDLVDAQQARRVLDRLLGYQISPILWQKVRKGLSAGRVQSVTTKLICDREKEIEAFDPKEYWTIELDAKTKEGKEVTLKYYGENDKKVELENEGQVNEILEKIKGKDLTVHSIESKSRRKSAPKPFTTSMLQQEAANKLGFTTKKTMMVAQELYEGVDIDGEGTLGLISYIRTDSKRISEEAKEKAKEFILEEYSDKYYKFEENKKAKTESKKVQDAHEAIRPTSVDRTPSNIKASLSRDQYKLYDLIWRRFVASQMEDSVFDTLNLTCKVDNLIFKATGSTLKFDGYTKVYNFTDREDKILPTVYEKDLLSSEEVRPSQHFTQPPARYTEASLVKTLEELGIGRPSTYAPTIATILNREYVEKNASSLCPTELGKIVTNILEENFQKFVDVDFTAQMENMLDDVAEGDTYWKEVVADVYAPLKEAIEVAIENIEKVNMDEETDEICENCGSNMVIKYGRFGKFIACKNYPECKTTKPLVNKVGVKCPKCGKGDIILRKSKKGKAFYGCSNYPECDFISWNKPTGELCSECNSYLVEKVTKSETKVICSNKECKKEKNLENNDKSNE
ncbi:type I DNA topoisomerase [Paraclostridium bifermentans]|uniref:type I DNA topoisomerase n=1 Tax=Paraclostridium TaxID=1849822 RepID=UPI00038CA359|nr:type I DNA topoisomerase [Paraclostridium bifermentans]EQK45997.1 DNA topoisomerase I [[Clostridium] bifermentans ATCC 19299] [Paraclostridium bifermentans ATCC 19299]MCE9675666.1 type I DNA topoisomerase [Paraclostridium bifermentans]MCR1876201.1 type I DNA topoisomerase [Paraclostridium bifermentans]TQO58727.1 type I DNA topoisomerase [Paraclostridium bifermentans]UOW67301.1 type I DNA topoisomerase [Paraclostridium bifermentans]